MHILIIGAAGMVGRKLTSALASAGQVGGKTIDKFTLTDVIEPAKAEYAGEVVTLASDVSAATAAA